MSIWTKTACAAMTLVGITLATIGLGAAQTPSPPGAKAYIINLKDGDTVASPFKVEFGLTGMGVAPADELKAPIVSDAKHVHYGGGQTEAMVALPPGKHTLQLVLGDWSHAPHVSPVMSTPITVTVN